MKIRAGDEYLPTNAKRLRLAIKAKVKVAKIDPCSRVAHFRVIRACTRQICTLNGTVIQTLNDSRDITKSNGTLERTSG